MFRTMIEPKEEFKFSKANAVTAGETSVYTWTVPSTLNYFRGHFPENPVLPAVAIVDACLELIRLEKGLSNAPYLRNLKSLKVNHVIQPNDSLRIEVGQVAQQWRIHWFLNDKTVVDFVSELI